MRMQHLIEIYHAVQDLWAFILTDHYPPDWCSAKPCPPNITVTHASVWTMLTCILMQDLIKLYHLVIKLWEFNNDRITTKERKEAQATGCLNMLWHQVFALDSAGFLSKHKRNRGFLAYAKHYHRETNYQWFHETKNMAHRQLELKSTSCWAKVGTFENKH